MKKVYTASHIANYFIENQDSDMSNIKLNKLVYIAYGVALASYNRELFHEGILAWRLGPVIPSVYHEFKKYGYGRVKDYSYFLEPMTEKKVKLQIDDQDDQVKQVLEVVNRVYGGMSIGELINKTHNKDTPWSKVYKDNVYEIEIEQNEIKEYYKKFIVMSK